MSGRRALISRTVFAPSPAPPSARPARWTRRAFPRRRHGKRLLSAEPELDAVGTARVTPVDRVLAEMLADDCACTEFDATLRVVHEFPFLEAIHLGRAHVQARFRVAGAAHVRVDGDERFFVELEPIEADAIVHRQGL